MIAGQKSISLSAGGLKDLTFEWYLDLIKGGYSTAVVLEAFIDQ